MLLGLTNKRAMELTMADRRLIVANYLATNRKPKFVANLLPIFDTQAFVFVRLWQLFFERDEISRGRILVFKTGALNHSAIPPSFTGAHSRALPCANTPA